MAVPDIFNACLHKGGTNHLIISGPCSAESEMQVMETARKLKKTGKVHLLRAGLWKPRTRPSTFTGIGDAGLPWLVRAARETGLPVCTEVALPEHAESCLKAGIPVVWIGARTVSNPFSVQELAKALQGSSVCVMVKNPLNPDIELWIGAIERFQKAGIKSIAAIHRGFYPFEHSQLRNIPKWELAIELKSRFPEMPVICDVSHIAGSRDFLADIAQKALDLNMDGLMIESHISPDEALSDARQQITPRALKELLDSLTFRNKTTDNIEFRNNLEQLRAQIDSIDAQVVELLASRMKLVDSIGKYKKANNIAIVQVQRWNEILSTRLTQAKRRGLSARFLNAVLQQIHKESIRRQTQIFRK